MKHKEAKPKRVRTLKPREERKSELLAIRVTPRMARLFNIAAAKRHLEPGMMLYCVVVAFLKGEGK